MDRRAFISVVGASILTAPLAAEAQRAGEVHRIGYLGTRSPSDFGLVAFRQGLRELGWVEGQNLVIEYRFAEGRLERLPDLAAELLEKIDRLFKAMDQELLDLPLTDVGNAGRLVYLHGSRFRWAVDRKTWLVWDGRRWAEGSG